MAELGGGGANGAIIQHQWPEQTMRFQCLTSGSEQCQYAEKLFWLKTKRFVSYLVSLVVCIFVCLLGWLFELTGQLVSQ